MFISYAQNFEDVLLWRALRDVKGGFYIDVGAQDPLVDSVSLAFYEQGWRGVHVEASSTYAELLRRARPDEDVVEAVIGDEHGDVQFFDIAATGLSTANPDVAARHAKNGHHVFTRMMSNTRLATILDKYRDRDIHWLKIDVEGNELSVLRSWQPSSVRPWIVVIEAVDPLSHEDISARWEPDLVALGYIFAYADGLNRFYVSEAHQEFVKVLAAGPNVFDDFALSGTSSASFSRLLTSRIARHEQELLRLQAVIQEQKKRDAAILHQLDVLNERILSIYRSTSWRTTGPMRRVSRVIRDRRLKQILEMPARGLLLGVRRRMASLARRIMIFFRSHAPRLYSILAERALVRRVYLRSVGVPQRTSSYSNASSRPNGVEAATSRGLWANDFLAAQDESHIDTRDRLFRAMSRWRKGTRIDA
jgi:FkbM family methyltransferase